MFASLLPGLREIRTPLAAGYVWLAFAYFVTGSPADLSELSGPISDLAEALDSFSSVAIAIAVSFVAYLIGSLSVDLFGVLLPRGLAAIAKSRVLSFVSDDVTEAATVVLDEAIQAIRHLNDIRSRFPQVSHSDDEARNVRMQALMAVSRFSDLLSEVQSQGRSEEQQPEAKRPMLEAEEDLRTAVVPPLVAVSTYLSVECAWWLFGVVFAVALYLQAAIRHAEAAALRIAHHRSLFLTEAQTAISRARSALSREDDQAAFDAIADVDWRQLRSAFRAQL